MDLYDSRYDLRFNIVGAHNTLKFPCYNLVFFFFSFLFFCGVFPLYVIRAHHSERYHLKLIGGLLKYLPEILTIPTSRFLELPAGPADLDGMGSQTRSLSLELLCQS